MGRVFPIFQMSSLPVQVLRFLAWLKKTEGRDKLYRLVAYGSKIPIHYLKTNGGDKELIARLSSGAKSVGTSRKLMRMFRSLEFLQDLLKSFSTKDLISQYLQMIKSTFLAIWMLLDHYQWLGKAGYVKIQNDKLLATYHSKAWFIGLFAGICGEGYKFSKSENKNMKSGKKLIKSSLDIVVPIARLEWLPINDGIVGVCGTITSLMGIYDTFE